MGSGPSSTTTQSGQSTTSPWAPAIPYLQNILSATGGAITSPTGNQQQAANGLLNALNKVPNYGGQASNLTKSLLGYNTNPQQGMLNNAYGAATGAVTGGVNAADSMLGSNFGNTSNFLGGVYGTAGNTLQNAYNTASGALSPYLNANYTNPMAVPGFANTMQAIGQQTQQATDALFSAAGRDPAGNAQAAKAAATATMNAEAPYLTNEYNALVGQQQGAGQYLGTLGANIGGTQGQLGANIGGTIGSLGLGTGGTLGQLGLSEGGTLGNLGISTAGALTGQQQAGFGTNLEGVNLGQSLPGIYAAPEQAALQATNLQANLPLANLAGLEGLVNPIAGLGGTSINFGTGTTQGSTSTMGNVLGGLLGAGALFGGGGLFPGALGSFGTNLFGNIGSALSGSDIRLKEDIEPLGTLSSGVPLYTFRYKGDPETRIGPMAQEVERMYPEAVVTHSSGYKMVDYNAINKGLLGGVL